MYGANAYVAGLATAVAAIAAGFAGGLVIANSLDTQSAVPAPGMSRIERTMSRIERTKREEPKPVAVETTAQAPQAEERAVNQLAEAGPRRTNAEPAPPRSSELQQSYIGANDALLHHALQSISSPQANHQETQHAQSPVQVRTSAEPRMREAYKRRQDIARRDSPRSNSSREVARYHEGDVRYVIRTEHGRAADAAEVELLKRELRERRANAAVETRSFSYQPERRRAFSRIFPD